MFLSLTWSNRTPHKFSLISHFKVYHRERAREIVGLLGAPSVLETEMLNHGKDYQWLKYIKVRPQGSDNWKGIGELALQFDTHEYMGGGGD